MNNIKTSSFLILYIYPLCCITFKVPSARDKISYDALVNMNVSCHPRDTCEGRTGNFYDGYPNYLCTCDRWCSRLGTCCIDSPYRGLYPTMEPTCRTVGDFCYPPDSFYMVDRCGVNTQWQSLCETEKEDDIMKIAPVTSLSTSVTYKNYFCFRCHESTDDFSYWIAKFENSGIIDSYVDYESSNVMYDHHKQSWVAVDGNGASFNVKYWFHIPGQNRNLAVPCTPDVISECSASWTDGNVRNLCKAYAADVYKSNNRVLTKYKNVHCAICNFLPVEDVYCDYVGTYQCYNPVAFEKLINLNNVGGNEKCEEGSEYDPLTRRCRKAGCLIPGYVIKNGRCAPP